MRHHLFNARNLDRYRDDMTRGLDALTRHVDAVAQPFSGAGVPSVAQRVAEVDLDEPLPDLGAALDEMRTVYLDDAVWFHEPTLRSPTSTAPS